jgi:hypothetical protein
VIVIKCKQTLAIDNTCRSGCKRWDVRNIIEGAARLDALFRHRQRCRPHRQRCRPRVNKGPETGALSMEVSFDVELHPK